jgi:hypothetical protein
MPVKFHPLLYRAILAAILASVLTTPVSAKPPKGERSDADICRVNLTDGSKEARSKCEAQLARYRAMQAQELEHRSEPYITFRQVKSGLMVADYERTIVTLNAAKKAGKGQAAYLLAMLHMEGRGVPQSAELADQNFQFALDNGFPEAVESFVNLYRDGRLTQVDKVHAQRIIDAEIKRGNWRAQSVADELKRLDTLKRAYAVPHPDGRVTVEQIDGAHLRPMEADKGFFDGIWKLHNESFEHNPQIIADLTSRLDHLETPYLYELARRVAASNKGEGLKWFWLARLRMEYDTTRCSNEATQVLTYRWRAFYDYDFRKLERAERVEHISAFNAALEIDKTLPTNIKPWYVCAYEDDQMYVDPRTQNRAIRIKPVTEWPSIKRDAINSVRMMAEGTLT